MKLITPIDIDLLAFIKTGKFDYLKLGHTKEWIINNFPDPDGLSEDNYGSPIWSYGNIELHFRDNDELFLIYSDYIDTLDGGQSLKLKKWIFEEPEKLNLGNVISHLNKERISFKLEHRTVSHGFLSTSIEILLSQINLNFALAEKEDEDFENYLMRCKTDDTNTFQLTSFSLMDK